MARVKRGGKWVSIPKGAEVTRVGRKPTGSTRGRIPPEPSASFESSLVVGKYKYDPVSKLYYTRTAGGSIVGASSATNIQIEIEARRSGSGGAAARKVVLERQKAQEKAAAASKALEQKRIEQAKSFAEKTRIAREIVMSRQAQSEFQRILNFRSNLVGKGATEQKRKYTDVRTGDRLEISRWRDKFGNKTERIKNLTKGTTTYSTFARGRAGGSIRKTGSVSMDSVRTTKETASVMAMRVKIITSPDYPGRKVVTFPNGQTGTIKSTGRVVVGARLAGKRYVFVNGKIISIDGRDTTGRQEFVIPEPTVQAISKPTGIIARNIKKLNDYQKVKATSSIRNKQRKVKNELKLLGVTTVSTIINGAVAIIALPSSLYRLAKNPAQIKAIPGAIKRGFVGFGQTIRISPTAALGMIAGEILLLGGVGKVSKVVGKVSPQVTTRLSPYFRKVDKGIINIKTTKGKTTLEVGVIGKGVSLRKQAKLSGKKLKAAATVQGDAIINFLRNRQRVIRKPIPGEEALTVRTKLLLKKFDKDRISRKEFFELNKRLIRETGDKTLLERSLFLDPKGKVRFTRLTGEQPEAGIMDILRGDFTFRTPKPQILVFSDVSVARFPVGLRDVARKLKAGKTLTEVERIRLVEWQLKKSGKFKPIGDVRYRGGVELEVTIAPGELIKRVKKLGVTLINGKKVSIIEAKIFKPNPLLKSKISKANKGLLNKKQLKRLGKELERATGFKSISIRRTPVSRRRARRPVRGLRIGSRVARGRLDRVRGATKRPPRKGAKRRVARAPKRVTRRVTKRRVARAPKRVTRRPPARAPKRPLIIPRELPKQFTKEKLSKAQPVFFIKVKKKGRIVNLNPRPLTFRDAKDYLTFKLDRGIIRTGYLEPIGRAKNVVRVPKSIRGYYSRNKRKVRPYRIKVGKKKMLRNGLIEKRKYIQDTLSEKRALQLARKRAALKKRKTIKRKTIRRKSVKKAMPRRKLPTLNRLKAAKKRLLLKRKRMINKLKKR